MNLDFAKLLATWQETASRRGVEVAVVLSEWSLLGGLKVAETYPPAPASPYPTTPFTPTQVDVLYADMGSGWQKVSTFPNFVRAGFGTTGELVGGVSTPLMVVAFPDTSIALGVVLAAPASLTQMNVDQTTGIAIIRSYLPNESGPLAYDQTFSEEEVAALVAWMGAHGIASEEVAALIGMTVPQAISMMRINSRQAFVNLLLSGF